ncbi:MAG: hypothetical protein QW667_04055 [Candidatus Bathyarchaeia archaeon]
MLLAVDGKIAGMVAAVDMPKDDAAEAIKRELCLSGVLSGKVKLIKLYYRL